MGPTTWLQVPDDRRENYLRMEWRDERADLSA